MAETENKTDETPKKKSKLPLILALVVILSAAGVGAFLFLKPKNKEEQIDESLFYKQALLDTFIVNLMSNKHFLKVTIFIEYNPFALERWKKQYLGGGHGGGKADPFALPPELAEKKIKLSHVVITTLSSKTADHLLKPEGKELLREELVMKLNEALDATENIIVDVKFSEFIIQ